MPRLFRPGLEPRRGFGADVRVVVGVVAGVLGVAGVDVLDDLVEEAPATAELEARGEAAAEASRLLGEALLRSSSCVLEEQTGQQLGVEAS